MITKIKQLIDKREKRNENPYEETNINEFLKDLKSLQEPKKTKDIEWFNRFWELYNKKIWKPKCESKWNKLTKTDKDLIFQTLPLYLSTIKDKQYQKHPYTYLNWRSREDEILTNTKVFTYEDFKIYMKSGRYDEAKDILWKDKFFEYKKEYMSKMDFNT